MEPHQNFGHPLCHDFLCVLACQVHDSRRELKETTDSLSLHQDPYESHADDSDHNLVQHEMARRTPQLLQTDFNHRRGLESNRGI